ncbi:hypothetical protein D3C87_1080930 [compost metagenome]
MQVDQVGRQHVHAEHAGECCCIGVRRFGEPFGGVVDNRPQTVGVGFQFADEGEDPGFTGEVREHRGGPQITQGLYAGTLAAVAENHAMAIFQQSPGAVQADTLAGAGNENRGCGRSHERLASR